MLQAGHRKIVWLFLLFWMAVLHIWLFEKLMTTSLWALYVNLTLGWYLRRLIPFVWLAGALCMALWQLWSYQNFRRKALEHMKPVEESWMRSVCSQAAAEAGCENMPPLYQSSAVSTPLVLGKGLHYARTVMSPEDMQFIQTRNFDTTQVARMLGIPANLLLASVEGSSLTYQNIEQSWIEFSSYTLQAYAMPICDALSQLVPARQRIDMDWNKARRSDTKSRWEALQIAVGMGLLTLDEARDWEGMPPRDETQTISNDTEVEA